MKIRPIAIFFCAMAVAALFVVTSNPHPGGAYMPQRELSFHAPSSAHPKTLGPPTSEKTATAHFALPQPRQIQLVVSTSAVSRLADQQLRQILSEQDIPEYPSDQVHDYLTAEAKRVGQIYSWVPLTAADNDKSQWPVWQYADPSGHSFGAFAIAVYTKQVPHVVRELAEHVRGYVPDAKFYISDIRTYPDPFMAVGVKGRPLVIIAQWDEPGFSCKPLKKASQLFVSIK